MIQCAFKPPTLETDLWFKKNPKGFTDWFESNRNRETSKLVVRYTLKSFEHLYSENLVGLSGAIDSELAVLLQTNMAILWNFILERVSHSLKAFCFPSHSSLPHTASYRISFKQMTKMQEKIDPIWTAAKVYLWMHKISQLKEL